MFVVGVTDAAAANCAEANVELVPAAVIKFPFNGKFPFTELAFDTMPAAAVNCIPTVSPAIAAVVISEATVISTELPAGTVNKPVGSLNVTIPDATEAESVNLVAPCNR